MRPGVSGSYQVAGALHLLLGAAIALPAQESGRVRALTVLSGSSGPVHFARFQGLIFFELTGADGAPVIALLDTGANVSAIDPRRSEHLPAEDTTTVQGSTGAVPAEMVRIAGLRLGAGTMQELRATRRPLTGLRTGDGRDVDLILGADAFQGGHLVLDFSDGTLCWDPGPSSAVGIASSMVLDNGIPAIPAMIATVRTWLRIDSGAGLFETDDIYVNVPMPLWDILADRVPGFRPEGELLGIGIGGDQVTLPYARFGPAHIASFRRDSIVLVAQPARGYFAEPHALGFVGNNFLEKLGRVTLDFAESRLIYDEHSR